MFTSINYKFPVVNHKFLTWSMLLFTLGNINLIIRAFDMSDIRDRIIKKMRELNLRQVDLINQLGVSKGTVSKWISGLNTPSSEVLPDLARVLNTSPQWLIKGDGIDRSEVSLQQVDTWDSNTPLDDDEVEVPFFKD